jgi:large subunit ribosomal protein L35
MPKVHTKLRTHKTTSKRFRATGTGKIQQPTTSAQHLRSRKSSRVLDNAKGYKLTAKGQAKRISRLLPHL